MFTRTLCVIPQCHEAVLCICVEVLPLPGLDFAGNPGVTEEGEMGEKGNLVDMAQDILADLAEQGPQLYLDFKQYQLNRASSPQVHAPAEQQAGGQDPAPRRPGQPAAG